MLNEVSSRCRIIIKSMKLLVIVDKIQQINETIAKSDHTGTRIVEFVGFAVELLVDIFVISS